MAGGEGGAEQGIKLCMVFEVNESGDVNRARLSNDNQRNLGRDRRTVGQGHASCKRCIYNDMVLLLFTVHIRAAGQRRGEGGGSEHGGAEVGRWRGEVGPGSAWRRGVSHLQRPGLG